MLEEFFIGRSEKACSRKACTKVEHFICSVEEALQAVEQHPKLLAVWHFVE